MAAAAAAAAATDLQQDEPSPKLLSAFQVVKFPNDACESSSNVNGTCYTESECSQRGGTSSGSCAEGFGVCCTFSISCSETSSENNTYIKSTGSPTGMCRYKICKQNSNICQLRLDFNTFVITGPSTSTTSVMKTLHGVVTDKGTKPGSYASRCSTDSFIVTAEAGKGVPVVCGTLTGEHMYVDAKEGCNELTFLMGSTAVGATLATRSWDITVTQYECGFINSAPAGCTQYFYGNNDDIVKTFNYDGSQHLALQKQTICVRKERGNCQICWSAMSDTDFMVSGKGDQMKGFNKVSICGGYGSKGTLTSGYDFVVIPGATKKSDNAVVGSQICGRSKGLITVAAGTTAASVCSKSIPFNIAFISDDFEFAPGAISAEQIISNKGFQLIYQQQSC